MNEDRTHTHEYKRRTNRRLTQFLLHSINSARKCTHRVNTRQINRYLWFWTTSRHMFSINWNKYKIRKILSSVLPVRARRLLRRNSPTLSAYVVLRKFFIYASLHRGSPMVDGKQRTRTHSVQATTTGWSRCNRCALAPNWLNARTSAWLWETNVPH